MSCLLYVDEKEAAQKVNIDDLYEKKHQRDIKMVTIFSKILNRIHKRIQFTGRNKRNDKHIWFTVPEFIFGEPNYDKAECLAYLVTKLEDNGFYIRYLHPNTLFVSWDNWVPAYARAELKKRTGVAVDEYGNVLETDSKTKEEEAMQNSQTSSGKPQKQFTPIDKYKPTGNLVYKPEMFEHVEKKVQFNVNR